MNWFKSIWLTSRERAILKQAEEDEKNEDVIEMPPVQLQVDDDKPYKKLIYYSDILTVIFKDEEVISKANVDKETFIKVSNATSRGEIEVLLMDKVPENIKIEKIEEEEAKLVGENSHALSKHPDFIVNKDKVYLKNISVPISSPVVFSFIEIVEKIKAMEARAPLGKSEKKKLEELNNNFTALKMFWLWLVQSPLEQCRRDLINFVRKNNVQITINGNLVLYRRIVSSGKSTDKKLTTFISQTYYNRKKQKKAATNPKNYVIVAEKHGYNILKTEDAKKQGVEWIGNLNDMYKNLDQLEENIFLSSSSGKNGQLPIKIGSIYRIPETEINLDNGNCAAGGLHAAAVDYDYSGYGDTPVVVLVNPSKAITVPTGDTGKMRTTEMFIACVNDKPSGTHFDEGDLVAFDEEYTNVGLAQLEEVISSKKLDPLSIRKKVTPASMVDIQNIKTMIQNRIKVVN